MHLGSKAKSEVGASSDLSGFRNPIYVLLQLQERLDVMWCDRPHPVPVPGQFPTK